MIVGKGGHRRPVHLSTVCTGEAQSVVARNGVLYADVWGSRELVICDVSDPYRPAVISKTPLDQYGDGVALRGNYCFVATGHHARGWRRKDEDTLPQHGGGHGLEILDVSDPEKPVFVSRVKTRRFYRIGMDMWDVMVAGDYAFLGETYNGVFVVDISKIDRPRFVAHRQLATVPRSIDGLETGEHLPAPVGGIALAKDTLYVAGAWTDLHSRQVRLGRTQRETFAGRVDLLRHSGLSSDRQADDRWNHAVPFQSSARHGRGRRYLADRKSPPGG